MDDRRRFGLVVFSLTTANYWPLCQRLRAGRANLVSETETGKLILKLTDRLFGEKQPFDNLCQELARLFYPERASFTQEIILGNELATDLFHSYPVLARRDLGNSFNSMLRPRGQEWFSNKARNVKNLTAYGKAWLEGTQGVMRTAFYDSKTRFVRTLRETDHDYAAFGNAVLSIEPRRNRDGLIYRSWHLGSVAWGEDEYGFPSPIVRKEKMTAQDIAYRFGTEKLPQTVRDKANDPEKYHEKFEVVHCVMPAEDWPDYGSEKIRQPWASVYVLRDGSTVLRVEGTRSKRYNIPRWQTVSGSAYALSPASIVALPDARMIQRLACLVLEAGEKAVDPPVIATHGAVLSDVNIFSGGTTWVDKVYDERLGASIKTLDIGGNPNIGADMLQGVLSRIADAFYLSKLVMPQQAGKTAYETARLVEEYIRAAIPLFEPLETEYTQPVLEDSFAELMALGAFGKTDDIPDELAGEAVEFGFSNPLQETIELQKATKFANLAGLLAQAGQMEQVAQSTESGQQLDTRTMFRDAGMAISPASWWRDLKDIEKEGAPENPQQEFAEAVQTAGGVKQIAEATTSTSRALQAAGEMAMGQAA